MYLGIIKPKDPEEGEVDMADGVHILPPSVKSCHNPDKPYNTRSAEKYGENLSKIVMGEFYPKL